MINKIFVVTFPNSMQSIADSFEEAIKQTIVDKLKEIAPDGFTSEEVEGSIESHPVKPSSVITLILLSLNSSNKISRATTVELFKWNRMTGISVEEYKFLWK